MSSARRALAASLAIAMIATACGEVVYTGLDEHGRPIGGESTTTVTMTAPVEPIASEFDWNDELVRALELLTDALSRLAAAGRGTEGEQGFNACTDLGQELGVLRDAGALETVEAGALLREVDEIDGTCRRSNSVRTYQELAGPAGELAGQVRTLVGALTAEA